MNADERRFFDSLTESVLGAIFEVANTLGAGFLEKVYERALLRTPGVPTYCPMPELSARLGQESLSFGQFSEANRRMEAGRPPFRVLGSALPAFVDFAAN